MTITMQRQLATGYIPEALDHGIHTHVPKKNKPPVVNNMRPLTMLNERAKIRKRMTRRCANSYWLDWRRCGYACGSYVG